MTTHCNSRVTHWRSNAATRAALVAAVVAGAAATTPALAMEQVSFVYERIVWTYPATRSKLEEDLRRAIAASQIKVSAAEIAGAAQAAFDGGVEHQDSWEEQTIIRACGPAQALCVVITCKNCSSGK